MEFRYREDSLPIVKRKALIRGAWLLALSCVCLAFFWLNVPWYLSLLPGGVFFVAAVSDFWGVRGIEKYRNAHKIIVSERGIAVEEYGIQNAAFWPWQQVSIKKEKIRNGTLSSFTISTGDRYLKHWEFTKDLESFGKLYELVCINTHA